MDVQGLLPRAPKWSLTPGMVEKPSDKNVWDKDNRAHATFSYEIIFLVNQKNNEEVGPG